MSLPKGFTPHVDTSLIPSLTIPAEAGIQKAFLPLSFQRRLESTLGLALFSGSLAIFSVRERSSKRACPELAEGGHQTPLIKFPLPLIPREGGQGDRSLNYFLSTYLL